MLVLITSFIPVVSGLLGVALSLIIRILNFSIEYIEDLPFATYRGVFITTTELLLIFGLTISIAVILINRRKYYVYIFFTFMLLLLSSFTFRKYESLKQRNIIVYDIPKVTAIQFTDGKKALLFADSALLANESKLEYHIGNYLWSCGIRNLEKIDVDNGLNNSKLLKKGNFLQFYGRKIFVVDDKTKLFDSSDKIRVDYLIISHNAGMTIEDVITNVDFKKVIIDSSNSPWRVKKWREECEEAGIDCHCVGENGAFMQTVCN
jgi:competence protein ComEC